MIKAGAVHISNSEMSKWLMETEKHCVCQQLKRFYTIANRIFFLFWFTNIWCSALLHIWKRLSGVGGSISIHKMITRLMLPGLPCRFQAASHASASVHPWRASPHQASWHRCDVRDLCSRRLDLGLLSVDNKILKISKSANKFLTIICLLFVI